MIAFNKNYFIVALLLFLTEVAIAYYLHTGFIRAYGGDFLVVIFLYCLVKSFVAKGVLKTAIGVLIFAYAVEISQYFHLVKLLGLQNANLAKLVLGTTFSTMDLLIYTMGIMLVIVTEVLIKKEWKTIL